MEVEIGGFGPLDIGKLQERLGIFGEVVAWIKNDSEDKAVREVFASQVKAGEVIVIRGYSQGKYLLIKNRSDMISDQKFKEEGELVDSFWKDGRHGVSTQYLTYKIKVDGKIYFRTFEGGCDREND